MNTNRMNKSERIKFKKRLFSSVSVCGFIILSVLIAICLFRQHEISNVSAEETGVENQLENALFTRQEFFGAQAVVPFPTARARKNLAELQENFPDNAEILRKLAGLDEKLNDFDSAEKELMRLSEIEPENLEDLAEFYNRRAHFDKEAETLERMLSAASAEDKPALLSRLFEAARQHDLQKYFAPQFYEKIARENPSAFAVFEQLIDKLVEENNSAEALNLLRQTKARFPEKQDVLREKEVSILLEMKKPLEAEAVYQASFNPFWSREETENFYQFLSEQDRLRAYGAELKTKFKQNPADFDTAIRLAHYSRYGYDAVTPIFLKLEKAKKTWTSDELLIAARFLIRENEPELASRFLYTLYLQNDLQANKELRAKVLYQLFEIFSDAEQQKLSLVKGDLRFYEDVAQADSHPGIATGILSLLFSDADAQGELDEKARVADGFFNRAAAYRIFLLYKEENPASPELAQMYLDIVRLYTATNETEIAGKTLSEFEQKYETVENYPQAALKLADAFVAANQPAKEREIYQKVLDYLGKQGKILAPPNKVKFQSSDRVKVQNQIREIGQTDGINVPAKEKPDENNYYEESLTSNFHDYLDRKDNEITYAAVLERFVNSLAEEKQTARILELYSNEIAKYPDEQWLYQRRLNWLEQTNLTEEQLRVYRQALDRFQTNEWRDKLARWFLRQNRQAEFAEFSTDLIGKLDDAETANYLAQFVDAKISASEFDRQLYLKLYQSAHARFPHNITFVNNLLKFYKANKQETEWRNLAAAYYFESKEVRERFLDNLAEKDELRRFLSEAETKEDSIYKLFCADAAVRLSNYEAAVATYRELNRLYPNTPEFAGRLVNFTRSFGQKSRESLTEAANVSYARAEFLPSSAERLTESGEIYAELGDYETANAEWEKLISTAEGTREIYLDTATVYWDYFRYDKALRTIENLRQKFGDETLYAFEAGAILESQHKKTEAIGEYVRALDAKGDEEQKEKAQKRLVKLIANHNENAGEKSVSDENELMRTVDSAFVVERNSRKDASFLTLAYAEFLSETKQEIKAEKLLNQAIAKSDSVEFLESARDFYATNENPKGEQTTLRRLSEIETSPRRQIARRLQLADSLRESQNRDAAKSVLTELVRKFPTNYGVLTEAADFFWHLGFEAEAVNTLQSGANKGRGNYRKIFARKLATRFVQMNRLDSAAQILTKLHDEDKADTEIFHELAGVFVRQNDAESLRKTFDETVAALKQTDADRRELDGQIADLRTQMIDAFTRLKNYPAAIEQHIEIINREPDDEEKTEAAIRYVQRYGAAETLLDYYRKTSSEAFKNYRWNVVLARIYEANKDWTNAARSYQSAIVNQPEMPELYADLGEIEVKQNDFNASLKNFDQVLELTNDAPEYVRRKIEILKKAGRLSEIAAEKAKLPGEEKTSDADRFAEAEKLQNSESERARLLYREAFAALLENPLSGELKAADISAYVTSVREEEPLNSINEKLWQLREKFIKIADQYNSIDAGEARKRLQIFDRALTESVGSVAENFGTDDELARLHTDFNRRIDENSAKTDAHQTLALIQDLSHRTGFGDLEEKILRKKLEAANPPDDKQICLQNLLNFYSERGAYKQILDVLEQTGSDDLPLKAETARLAGNQSKELEALRSIYRKADKLDKVSPDANVARYLEILDSENRTELESLTEKSSVYQTQLINFLLGKGEIKLAHAAIENANLPASWKLSRSAETSLALKEFGSDCYFCKALQLGSIGEIIKQTPDKQQFLMNDDWFRLTKEYGEWLKEKEKLSANTDKRERSEADRYLTAMTENRPVDAAEQSKLGAFYLEKNEFEKAIEHFRLALELNADDKTTWASLGAAYYLIGKKDFAEESWKRVLADEEIESGATYFQVLQKYDLAAKARENLPSIIVKFLATNDAEQSADFQNLIRAVASSFNNEAEKSAYFLNILKNRTTDTSLAEMLTSESVIEKNRQNEFYELLIERSDDLKSSDYNFTSVFDRVWTNDEAEAVFDQENDYKTEEPENERFRWQKAYVALLLEQTNTIKAARLTGEIEKELSGRFARPDWLRIAEMRLRVRGGKFDFDEAEKFVGIRVPDSVAEIKPPSVERLNEVIDLLKQEKLESEQTRISEAFFARMLALEKYDDANFVGLARAFFRADDTPQALRILQIMADAADTEKRETALAELASIDAIKMNAADAAKLAENDADNSANQAAALKLAAETALEFQQPEAAISFRRQLLLSYSNYAENKIELAKILVQNNQKQEAASLLTQVANDKNAFRKLRWQAVWELKKIDVNTEIKTVNFDAYSQFYSGLLAENEQSNETATDFLSNSLIADEDAEISARQELLKLYVLTNKPFAALKLADADKAEKSDAMLQMLSEAAEMTNDFAKAIEFEKAKTDGIDEQKINRLQELQNQKNRRATDFTVDLENTRKL